MWETIGVVGIVVPALFFSGRSLLRGLGSKSRPGCSGCSGCASQPGGDTDVDPHHLAEKEKGGAGR